MVEGRKAIDPTLGIHEQLTLNRDAQVPSGAIDYIDHMPPGYQRAQKKAWVAINSPAEDRAYREAFDKILATIRLLHQRGVFIVFGTDTGGSFTYHRELELYQRAGMTPAEILRRATFESARYLGQDQRLGSIEKGKLADFFLVPKDPTVDLKAIKTIRMVVKNGTVYYPTGGVSALRDKAVYNSPDREGTRKGSGKLAYDTPFTVEVQPHASPDHRSW
jgi:hypothetical protein